MIGTKVKTAPLTPTRPPGGRYRAPVPSPTSTPSPEASDEDDNNDGEHASFMDRSAADFGPVTPLRTAELRSPQRSTAGVESYGPESIGGGSRGAFFVVQRAASEETLRRVAERRREIEDRESRARKLAAEADARTNAECDAAMRGVLPGTAAMKAEVERVRESFRQEMAAAAKADRERVDLAVKRLRGQVAAGEERKAKAAAAAAAAQTRANAEAASASSTQRKPQAAPTAEPTRPAAVPVQPKATAVQPTPTAAPFGNGAAVAAPKPEMGAIPVLQQPPKSTVAAPPAVQPKLPLAAPLCSPQMGTGVPGHAGIAPATSPSSLASPAGAASVPSPAPQPIPDSEGSESALQEARHSLEVLHLAGEIESRSTVDQRVCSEYRKRIRLAVNQISADEAQVAKKIVELGRILNETRPNAGLHKWCLRELARCITMQGDDQVAQFQGAAFSIAAVAVGVAAEFPDFSEILIAQFHSACIYTVPYHPRKADNQSRDEHLLSLGFRKVATGLESYEAFATRTAGIVALYSAFMQTRMPNRAPHPRGISHAWTWLARVLNMKPFALGPTIILSVLETAGSDLHNNYGGQFMKLLRAAVVYANSVKATTNTQASIARLKLFLENALKKGSIPSHPDAKVFLR